MKTINLSQGKQAIVDDEDYEYLNQFKWCATKYKHTFYAMRIVYNKSRPVNIRMHRVILGTPKGMDVDHIDHNGLNNQKVNIRNCTTQQNCCNMNNFHKGKSIYRGVCFDKHYIKATISFNNKRIHIGNFKTEIDAAIAYDKKAKELHGEFCILNFP